LPVFSGQTRMSGLLFKVVHCPTEPNAGLMKSERFYQVLQRVLFARKGAKAQRHEDEKDYPGEVATTLTRYMPIGCGFAP
jgi:hypothetical protein